VGGAEGSVMEVCCALAGVMASSATIIPLNSRLEHDESIFDRPVFIDLPFNNFCRQCKTKLPPGLPDG
jgi:hypothetical protein